MPLITSGASMQSIMENQYYLARKANISISDSNNIPEFELMSLIGLLMKDLKQEKDALQR